MLRRYNNDVKLNTEFVHSFEDYFTKYWNDHKIYRIMNNKLDSLMFFYLPS